MDYKDLNDYELIYMVRENDDSSYDILFNKYLPVIRRISSEYYNLFSDYGYDFCDFLQEGYLGFQKALDSFNEDNNTLFYTFLIICLKRHLKCFCKRITCESKNINRYQFVDIDSTEIEDLGRNIDYNINKDIFIHEIWDVVYSFDDIMFSCVFELKINNFKYSEISELLDMDVKKIKLIQRRIYKAIRHRVEFIT